jgi:hypothetical protein
MLSRNMIDIKMIEEYKVCCSSSYLKKGIFSSDGGEILTRG